MQILDRLIDVIEQEKEKVKQLSKKETDATILLTLMKIYSYTQVELSTEVEIDNSTICQIIGKKKSLTRKQIGKICKRFNLSPEVFDFDGN